MTKELTSEKGYGPEYYTRKPCIERGCNEPAGTAWGPHWCKKHDIERRDRITKSLAGMVKALHGDTAL